MVRDRLFAAEGFAPKKFVFDERVALVFDDMITRSVPFYDEVHAVLLDLLEQHPPRRTYDLGCSTGNTLALLADWTAKRGIQAELIAVDNSKAMIAQCRQKLAGVAHTTFECHDIGRVAISKADLVILNYTLQFIPPDERPSLLGRIYRGLNRGGLLLLSEKLNSTDPVMRSLLERLYNDFKRRNGYSDEEILRKREALEEILIPATGEEHLNSLKRAGFGHVEMFFRRYNFASFVAIK